MIIYFYTFWHVTNFVALCEFSDLLIFTENLEEKKSSVSPSPSTSPQPDSQEGGKTKLV